MSPHCCVRHLASDSGSSAYKLQDFGNRRSLLPPRKSNKFIQHLELFRQNIKSQQIQILTKKSTYNDPKQYLREGVLMFPIGNMQLTYLSLLNCTLKSVKLVVTREEDEWKEEDDRVVAAAFQQKVRCEHIWNVRLCSQNHSYINERQMNKI